MINISKKPKFIQEFYEGDYDGITFEIGVSEQDAVINWLEDPMLIPNNINIDAIEEEIFDLFEKQKPEK